MNGDDVMFAISPTAVCWEPNSGRENQRMSGGYQVS